MGSLPFPGTFLTPTTVTYIISVCIFVVSFPLGSKELRSELELLGSGPRLTFYRVGELEQSVQTPFSFFISKMRTWIVPHADSFGVPDVCKY